MMLKIKTYNLVRAKASYTKPNDLIFVVGRHVWTLGNSSVVQFRAFTTGEKKSKNVHLAVVVVVRGDYFFTDFSFEAIKELFHLPLYGLRILATWGPILTCPFI